MKQFVAALSLLLFVPSLRAQEADAVGEFTPIAAASEGPTLPPPAVENPSLTEQAVPSESQTSITPRNTYAELIPGEALKKYRIVGGVDLLVGSLDAGDRPMAIADASLDNVVAGSLQGLEWDAGVGTHSFVHLDFLRSGWFTEVGWTILGSEGQTTLNAPDGGALYGRTADPATSNGAFATALGTTDITFHFVDVLAGYQWNRNARSNMGLFFGSRTAFYDESMDFIYSSPGFETRTTGPQKYTGSGIVLGIGDHTQLWKRLGGFARINTSVLFGNYQASYAESNDGWQTGILWYDFDKSRTVAGLDGLVGFDLCWQHLQIALGYQFNYFFGLADSYDFLRSLGSNTIYLPKETLAFNGLFLRVTLSY